MPAHNANARARSGGRWPYRAAPPARRRRVVPADASERRGALAYVPGVDSWRITPKQARIAIAAAAFLMLISAGWWAYRSPLLTVSHIGVTGTASVQAADVRAAAAINGD